MFFFLFFFILNLLLVGLSIFLHLLQVISTRNFYFKEGRQVRWVGSLKMLNLWWQGWQVGGCWGLTIFLMTNDDSFWAMHLVNKKRNFVFCPFFEWLEMKKSVSLLLQKNNNFFLYLFVLFWFQNEKNSNTDSNFLCFSLFVLFWFRPKWKKQFSLLLGFIKRRKKKKATATFFICLFFFLLRQLMTGSWFWIEIWYFLLLSETLSKEALPKFFNSKKTKILKKCFKFP